jgi:hypothetical protein
MKRKSVNQKIKTVRESRRFQRNTAKQGGFQKPKPQKRFRKSIEKKDTSHITIGNEYQVFVKQFNKEPQDQIHITTNTRDYKKIVSSLGLSYKNIKYIEICKVPWKESEKERIYEQLGLGESTKYSYVIRFTDKTGLVQTITTAKTVTKNYQNVLKRLKIPKLHCTWINKVTHNEWGDKEERVYIQYIKKDKSPKKRKQYTAYKKGECRLICLQSTEDSTNLIRIEKYKVEALIKEGKWKIIDKNTYKKLTAGIVHLKNKESNKIIAIKAKDSYSYDQEEWEYTTKEAYNAYVREAIYIKPPTSKNRRLDKVFKAQLKAKKTNYQEKHRAYIKAYNKKKTKSPLKRRRKRPNIKKHGTKGDS